MSLTKKQKNAIQITKVFAYADMEQDGKAYCMEGGEKKEFIIPRFSEILKTMFEKIKEVGIVEIERCHPRQANCIIRIYQDLHHEYDWGLCFNIYGADCYTLTHNRWETSDGINNCPIRYDDKYQFRVILMPDESLRVNADYVDCYVKIR